MLDPTTTTNQGNNLKRNEMNIDMEIPHEITADDLKIMLERVVEVCKD